jgi:N-acetyl-anhydromuramyl-L-alanine amidase AmpD
MADDNSHDDRPLPAPLRLAQRAETGCAWLLLCVALGSLAAAWLAREYGPGWWRQLLLARPSGIIIHHSASPASAEGQTVDVHLIDRWHERRGFARTDEDRVYHVGYHYVILPDGTIQRGRPERMRGAHCEGHNDQLGVCLVGNFSSSANPDGRQGPSRPTPAQLAALDHLLKRLIKRYGVTRADIHRHRDYASTACPGDRMPFAQVVEEAFR